jgi:hypothetical protein
VSRLAAAGIAAAVAVATVGAGYAADAAGGRRPPASARGW